MTFIWTPPDPLNNTAKTRSIYMTELQAAANVKRVEIAQSQLSFINQNIGKKFILSAIEELKTVVNQLAIDFGYPTGVEDSALLGRPYVTITKKYGKSVCHYPILNDLRQVLNLLVKLYHAPAFVATSWYNNSLPTVNPLANWEISSSPWTTIPLDVQTGVGTTCIEGWPTCNNTLAGFFRGNLLGVTDRSIIYYNIVDHKFYEGPIGGPYYNIDRITAGYTLIGIGPQTFDIGYFYFFNSNQVRRTKRDGSQLVGGSDLLGTLVGVVGMSDYAGSVAIGTNCIFIPALGWAAGPDVFYIPGFALVDKGGGILSEQTIPFQNLTEFGFPYRANRARYWLGSTWMFDGSNFVGTYIETALISSDTVWVVASAIIKISQSGTISLSDIKKYSVAAGSGTLICRPPHGGGVQGYPLYVTGGSSIKSITASGIFYELVDGDITYGALPPLNHRVTYNGATIIQTGITTDYKGDLIINEGGLYDNVENWNNKGGGITPDIIPVDFDSATRVPTGGDDKVNATFTVKPGTFRYRLQRRASDSEIWLTSKTVENNNQGTISDEILGLNVFKDYYIRIFTESGQGTLLSSDIYLPSLI